MKKTLASLVALATLATAPAIAEPVKSTAMVNESGKAVSSLFLRYQFDAHWVLNSKNVLMRDENLDYYLVTLGKECDFLDRYNTFQFQPVLAGRVYASQVYEIRDRYVNRCEISKVQQVKSRDEAKALVGA